MNKDLLNFILTVLLAVLFSRFLPWWSVMLAGFASAIIVSLKRWAVFFIPFLSVFLYWISLAYYTGSTNDFLLADKISVLLPLQGNRLLLLVLTGLIGGIPAGIAAVFGNQCLKLLKRNP